MYLDLSWPSGRNFSSSYTVESGYEITHYLIDASRTQFVFFSLVRTGGWRKINDDPVCFSALDDRYGAFTIKEDGFIDTFKLVHRRGRGIKCNRNFPAAYWGCLNRNNEPDILTTVITFSNNTALPIANFSETIGNTGALCRYYAYRISGVDVNSKELIFEGLHSPLWVKIGEEFRIWHGHDLVDCDEEDNSGHTCADAYAWYF